MQETGGAFMKCGYGAHACPKNRETSEMGDAMQPQMLAPHGHFETIVH